MRRYSGVDKYLDFVTTSGRRANCSMDACDHTSDVHDKFGAGTGDEIKDPDPEGVRGFHDHEL